MTTEHTETQSIWGRDAYPEQDLTAGIIGAAIEVHRYWGPGLYEEIYERSLCHELQVRGIPLRNQVALPLLYKGARVGDDLRLDLLVDDRVVVELKTVSEVAPVHDAQVLTYMRLTHCRVGLLINFYVPVLKNGVKRYVL
jgi:GxxExxY protein